MRRLLPWALLGLLTLGVAVGAGLGQAQYPGQTAEQWVDGVVAATVAAGTAHLRFVNVTTSTDPSQDSKSVGVGVVDFSHEDYRVKELSRQNQFESTNGSPLRLTDQVWGENEIAIGGTLYMNLDPSGPGGGWAKVRFPRNDRQDFGLSPIGAEDAIGGLVGPTPVRAVQTLGPSSVGGVPATRYRVTTEPLYVCGAHGGTLYVHRFAPTTLWVDGQDRLLRAQTSVLSPGFTSHGPEGASGFSQPIAVAPSTTAATLTLSHFGTPVHIAAPPLSGSAGRSIAIGLRAKGSTTPCRH